MSEERRELAWKAHREGDLQQAEQAYRALLRGTPTADDAVNLGALLRQQGRLREAALLYEDWLPRFPDAQQLHLNAANCLHDLKQHQRCIALLGPYLKRHPGSRKPRWALARSLTELRQHSQAEAMLRELTSSDPQDLSSWMDLGLCLHRQEKHAEALRCFEKVTELDPGHPGATANRIKMLKDAGRYDDCRALIQSLAESARTHPTVRGAIATLWMAQNNSNAAIAELVSLCWAEPNEAGHWTNLAATLRTIKHANAALRVLKRGLTRQPEAKDLQQALGQCLAELGRPDRALPVLRGSAGAMETIRDDYLFNIQFLGAGYHLIQPDELQAWARSWEQRVQQELGIGPLWPDAIREPHAGRRLRVGYLSADWCNHPVCRFMLPILEHHDRTEVEVWGLCSSVHRDAASLEAKARCDHWLELRHATDLEAARVIADLKLDVLVELGGYTGHSRIGVLIHRAAPIQLSYLGYFAPTYLKVIDGWIGDAELFGGLASTDQAAHTLWQVDGGYMAYASAVPLPPAERMGVERFRFGCFNHSRKLNPGSIGLFARVLKAVPDSELVLKSISFVEHAEKERVVEAFAAAGVDQRRLILLERTETTGEHLAAYNAMDVALDPFPYGGATTTCEALAMGVPVVTLAGSGMVGRLSASVLGGAGRQEWVATDQDDYVRIAMGLGNSGKRNKDSRVKLREKVLASPLCDGKRLSGELEKIYRQALFSAAAA